jgi:glycerol-3-phosphate dehydrogenase (NAD(P)+)
MARVAVLNAGGWGTALACVLAARDHEVTLWARRPELAVELAVRRENSAYLPGIRLPASLTPTADLAAALVDCRIVLVVSPSSGLQALGARAAGLVEPDALMLIGTKGLVHDTWQRPSELLTAALGPTFRGHVAVLSGPTHAEEVARGLPTAAVVACADAAAAVALQEAVATPAFRLYTSADVAGVELCGAAKNVIALAAGIGDGQGAGDNGKAALLTRSLAELGRFVMAYGGQPATVSGLAGVGDLIATCTSRHSRNRWAGEELGRGRPLDAVLRSTPMVVEGVPAARGIALLARRAGVELPICEAVNRVLHDGMPVADAIATLLGRALTAETPHADPE